MAHGAHLELSKTSLALFSSASNSVGCAGTAAAFTAWTSGISLATSCATSSSRLCLTMLCAFGKGLAHRKDQPPGPVPEVPGCCCCMCSEYCCCCRDCKERSNSCLAAPF